MAFVDNRPPVQINDTDGSILVELTYDQPSVRVDTEARYATHEPIGAKTVHQKLGEAADRINVNGHCTEDEATKIDTLATYDIVELVSSRWEGTAQVESSSTQPLAEGGAQNRSEEWIHTFTIQLTEVEEDRYKYDLSIDDEYTSWGGPGGQ